MLACLVALLSMWTLADASAETRTLKLYNTHTKERVSITFKKNGRYLDSGLREANTFLRDWRRNEATKIDPKLLDLVWEVYQEVGANKPIYVVSSYRSPATNNMLRKRSNGVAKNSQHTRGKAMDFYIPGVNLAKLRRTGLRKQVGGVGYYPTSGSPFVHMDTGSVRHWPRMTRTQLSKVFPDGKTLHVPTDGKPMSGYKIALAEAKKKKSTSSPTVKTASSDQKNSGKGFLASLFGRRDGPTPKENVGKAVTTASNLPAASAKQVAAALEPPPVPETKEIVVAEAPTELRALPQDRSSDLILTRRVPTQKPQPAAAPIQVASAPPNTLDAQRIAIENGTPVAQPAAERILNAAAFPEQKPASAALLAASRQAAGETANDPVAAIAAVTRNAVTPRSRPELGNSTLAYASATTLPPVRAGSSAKAPANASNKVARTAAKQSISGRIPVAEIQDPLAGFVSLPNKAEPRLITGEHTTRQRMFAALSHPNQRTLKNALAPGNRFIDGGFGLFPYGSLRTDRFDGPAIVILPVVYAR